ncbi:MAG: HNH endonuclease signature motif containing protein [Pseudonocardiaceae bacterium]
MFQQHVGPIPDGMELDHLCFTPACVRWEAAPGAPSGHLEVVTPAENLRRRRTTNQKLHNPDLGMALVLRAKGMRWRAIALELGCTHGPLITRLKKYCEVNGLEYPASESTRPRLKLTA